MPREERQEDRERRGHAAFAATAADDAPQLAHAPAGRRTIASNLCEDLALLIIKRQAKGGPEHHEPRAPRHEIIERCAEQVAIAQGGIDGERVALHDDASSLAT